MEQYYTPDISDLHVGYEFLYATHNLEDVAKMANDDNYRPPVVYMKNTVNETTQLSTVGEMIKMGDIRTPYLTKEQIEAEGWEYVEDAHFKTDYNYKLKKGDLTYYFRKIGDIATFWLNEDVTFFNGSCPSINEFRTICRLVGIPKLPTLRQIDMERMDNYEEARKSNKGLL